MNDVVAGSDPTAVAAAARARPVWEVYCGAGNDLIHDLIVDLLHMADVDGHAGGGRYAAQRALEDYGMERFGPVEVAPFPPRSRAYLSQVRPVGCRMWITVEEGDEPRATASSLTRLMQAADLRTGELAGFLDDLVRGECVTADDGAAFRVRRNPLRRAGRVDPHA
ncbi:hypothetical protein [Streptomyces murinus]